jgi:biopolymer transport protein ExbD
LQAAARGRELPLILRADGRTPHQAVVTVLEVAGQLGLKQLAIATVNPPATPSPPVPHTPPSPDP